MRSYAPASPHFTKPENRFAIIEIGGPPVRPPKIKIHPAEEILFAAVSGRVRQVPA